MCAYVFDRDPAAVRLGYECDYGARRGKGGRSKTTMKTYKMTLDVRGPGFASGILAF